MLFTPLEQFQIISLFSIKVFCLDFSLTNMLFINLIVLLIFSSMVYLFSSDTDYLGETSYFLFLILGKHLLKLFMKQQLS
jgi:hypothetical protein